MLGKTMEKYKIIDVLFNSLCKVLQNKILGPIPFLFLLKCLNIGEIIRASDSVPTQPPSAAKIPRQTQSEVIPQSNRTNPKCFGSVYSEPKILKLY